MNQEKTDSGMRDLTRPSVNNGFPGDAKLRRALSGPDTVPIAEALSIAVR
jgi:hypothetical protein